jgi:hypothetical protein
MQARGPSLPHYYDRTHTGGAGLNVPASLCRRAEAPERARQSLAEHTELVAAIRRRDASSGVCRAQASVVGVRAPHQNIVSAR